MENTPLLNMIQWLRENEEVILYDNVLKISEIDIKKNGLFLEAEYNREALDYPHSPPPFDKNAALWSAQYIYIAAQLIIHREHEIEDVNILLAPFSPKITPSAVLSADLCLRFLPILIKHLKIIDSTDPLINILEDTLHIWHYSGVQYQLDVEKLVFDDLLKDKCLMQLYANRIIDNKKRKLSELPFFRELIAANLGIYADTFWQEFAENI